MEKITHCYILYCDDQFKSFLKLFFLMLKLTDLEYDDKFI